MSKIGLSIDEISPILSNGKERGYSLLAILIVRGGSIDVNKKPGAPGIRAPGFLFTSIDFTSRINPRSDFCY